MMPSASPPNMPMSPTQAAQMIGVSRRTIMRAIERLELQANRDNRNHWRIDPADLSAWAAPTGQMPTSEAIAELRERLSAETARANAAERARDQAEADRDRWQIMAEKLTDRQRRGWWPWRK